MWFSRQTRQKIKEHVHTWLYVYSTMFAASLTATAVYHVLLT